MSTSVSMTHISMLLLRSRTMASSRTLPLLLSSGRNILKRTFSISRPCPFSTTATPYPLQYELIVSRPAHSPLSQRRKSRPPEGAKSDDFSETPETEETEQQNSVLGFEDWVDGKLSTTASDEGTSQRNSNTLQDMDKSKRKYYRKRRRRMYGTDSDDERPHEDKYVELKQEVVELPTLHKREEELYFYDAFAFPWEKEKHYKMVYQLEKKYFPDQCLDKAFVEPGESKPKGKKKSVSAREKNTKVVNEVDDQGLIFFDENEGDKVAKETASAKDAKGDISEKKVEEFFKCLKKVPNKAAEDAPGEPYMVTRKTELPPIWDGPYGTVVLVNKPKGWTSFTVCGKLRRLVKVQKVGHAGTLDPMATGLLIVCVGKATKLVERFQGMIKGYSGIFRLGEATSTWDADSPVIQREPWEHVKDEDIKKTAASFCGEIWQVPPMFSAIKVGGERMYEKARRGESVELSPRRVSLFQFDIERSLDDRQNLIFRVTCSKGTYIRSLCADFGKALGSCAHLTALRRDSIGQYSADDAWDFKELEEAITKGYF
ncbi:hypothetical protein NE237_008120 [Protea cynaroides]|uniref:tRNA pseudouridine(55) synthase n=1 Tax=Protea cynaroides TaxID=273540 RepID=A0A9Q0KRH8_9MAGN|nr:hypothetical protein NE237_008120 [Protea cynaroides]